MSIIKLQSLSPIYSISSTKLILGSIQSKHSKLSKQYYAHHQNRFWKVIGEKLKISHSSNYQERLTLLLAKGYAMWDVLQFAEKQDGVFEYQNIHPNNIDNFLRDNKQIKTLIFNGQMAFDLYRQHIGYPTLNCIVLAATSVSESPFYINYNTLKIDWQSLP